MAQRTFLACSFVAALVLTFVLALDPRPPALPLDGNGDKIQHMIAFATLALLARLGFPKARDHTILERLSFLGALIEVFQSIPSLHRDCDWRDWVADTLAVAVVLLVLRLWAHRKSRVGRR